MSKGYNKQLHLLFTQQQWEQLDNIILEVSLKDNIIYNRSDGVRRILFGKLNGNQDSKQVDDKQDSKQVDDTPIKSNIPDNNPFADIIA